MLRNLPSVMIGGDLPFITAFDFGIGEIADIISDGENHLVRYQSLIYQIQNEHIRHFPYN